MSNKKHFWQLHPEIDYEECLRERNLCFNQSKGEKLETIEGGPVPSMTQEEYDDLGDLVNGYV